MGTYISETRTTFDRPLVLKLQGLLIWHKNSTQQHVLYTVAEKPITSSFPEPHLCRKSVHNSTPTSFWLTLLHSHCIALKIARHSESIPVPVDVALDSLKLFGICILLQIKRKYRWPWLLQALQLECYRWSHTWTRVISNLCLPTLVFINNPPLQKLCRPADLDRPKPDLCQQQCIRSEDGLP